jgi:Rps23 Pro-64 3,4-dihydroxylase Tpa1-like proline 4-hydroxylase
MDDGNVITCSRTIGVIYYLTKDWQPEEGGHLVDLEDPSGQP